MSDVPRILAGRVVVVLPNWLGDGVMATPFLRALRGVYPGARIAGVGRRLVEAVCEGMVDEVKVLRKGEEEAVAKWMRGERFDLGVLLPNSFRSAWMLWRGGVRRRVGYARGGRGGLLTDRVYAEMRHREQRVGDRERARAIRQLGGGRVRIGSGFEPVPTIEYYLELARYLGAENPGRGMELEVTEAERSEAERALGELGISDLRFEISDLKDRKGNQPAASANKKAASENYVVMVPGANFGASKCWMPERFAAVAEKLADSAGEFGVKVVLAGSVAEGAICEAIAAAVGAELRERVVVLGRANGGKGISVGGLKAVVQRARLMVCNDTGPRHMAAALGVPTVTLFGPTDPVWSETYSAVERVVRMTPPPPCGPCQLKECPIDHRCMKGVTVEKVMEGVREMWGMAKHE